MQFNIPGRNHNAALNCTDIGLTAVLNAGGDAGGNWAWARYAQPLPAQGQPVRVTVYLSGITGKYWLGVYSYAGHRWEYTESNQPSCSMETDSPHWSVHVAADDVAVIQSSEFEILP